MVDPIPDHTKYITSPKFHEFLGSIFDMKLKQANLAINGNVSAVLQRANKIKEKIETLQTFDLIFLVIMIFKIRLYIIEHLIR